MSVATKTCTRCKVEKPLDEFHNAKDRPDGRRTACAVCERQRCVDRRRRIQAGEDVSRSPGGAECVTCGLRKPLDDFGKTKGKRRDNCRDCHATAIKQAQIDLMNADEWACNKCEVVKPRDQYSKDPTRATGYRTICRECATKDRQDRKKKQKAEGRTPKQRAKAPEPKPIERATKTKTVALVSLTVPDDEFGNIEADAHRHALREIVQAHGQQYDNIRFRFETDAKNRVLHHLGV